MAAQDLVADGVEAGLAVTLVDQEEDVDAVEARTAWTVIWSGSPGPMPMTSSSRMRSVSRTPR